MTSIYQNTLFKILNTFIQDKNVINIIFEYDLRTYDYNLLTSISIEMKLVEWYNEINIIYEHRNENLTIDSINNEFSIVLKNYNQMSLEKDSYVKITYIDRVWFINLENLNCQYLTCYNDYYGNSRDVKFIYSDDCCWKIALTRTEIDDRDDHINELILIFDFSHLSALPPLLKMLVEDKDYFIILKQFNEAKKLLQETWEKYSNLKNKLFTI